MTETPLPQIPEQPHVRLVARGIQLTALDALLYLAVGLVHVGAVGEATEFRGLVELGEVIAQGLAIQIPEAELADAGGVDQVRAVAEVVERRRARRVPSGAALVERVRSELQACVERVQDRRLADAAMTDEGGHLP